MEGFSHFMSIPPEIRQMILNKLPQNNALLMRTICQQLQIETDTFYDFEIQTKNLTVEVLKDLLNLRIKKFHINHSSSTIHLYQIIKSIPGRETLFKYKNALKSLQLQTNNIHRTDYHLLLQESSQSLTQLNVHWNHNQNHFTSLPHPIVNFKNLQSLKVFDDRSETLVIPDLQSLNSENDIFLNLMESIRSTSKLHCLAVKLSYKGISAHELVLRYTFALLSFICQHSKYLSPDFNFHHRIILNQPETNNSSNDPGIQNAIRHFTFNQALFSDVQNLKRIHVNCSKMQNPVQLIPNSWKCLISKQCQLELLNLNGIGPVLKDTLFTEVVRNNCKTLRYISIRFAANEANTNDTNIDLSIFQNCVSLQTLKLREMKPVFRNGTNFMLPKSLIVLRLHRIKIKTAELKKCFRRKTGLERVEITMANENGYEIGKGVDGFALELILKQRMLLNLRIAWFTYTTNLKYEKLKSVIHRFYPNLPSHKNYTDLELCLRRDLPQHQFVLVDPK